MKRECKEFNGKVMNVKELRTWLADFGDKHKQHFERNLIQLEKEQGQEDTFQIRSNPSAKVASPTSSRGKSSLREIDRLGFLIYEDHKQLGGNISQNHEEKDEIPYDASRKSSSFTRRYGQDEFCSYEESNGGIEMKPSADPTTTTQTTQEDSEVDDEIPRMLEGSWDTCQRSMSEEEFSDPEFEHYSLPDDDFDTNSLDTVKLSSQASSKQSAVPVAIEPKLAKLMPQQDNFILSKMTKSSIRTRKCEAKSCAAGISDQMGQAVRQKTLNPKDIPFLQPEEEPTQVTQTIEQRPRSSLDARILKFGGPRKPIVERRKDELEKLWSEKKAVTRVSKTKWFICQKTGVYKKKIVLDVQH